MIETEIEVDLKDLVGILDYVSEDIKNRLYLKYPNCTEDVFVMYEIFSEKMCRDNSHQLLHDLKSFNSIVYSSLILCVRAQCNENEMHNLLSDVFDVINDAIDLMQLAKM